MREGGGRGEGEERAGGEGVECLLHILLDTAVNLVEIIRYRTLMKSVQLPSDILAKMQR